MYTREGRGGEGRGGERREGRGKEGRGGEGKGEVWLTVKGYSTNLSSSVGGTVQLVTAPMMNPSKFFLISSIWLGLVEPNRPNPNSLLNPGKGGWSMPYNLVSWKGGRESPRLSGRGIGTALVLKGGGGRG